MRSRHRATRGGDFEADEADFGGGEFEGGEFDDGNFGDGDGGMGYGDVDFGDDGDLEFDGLDLDEGALDGVDDEEREALIAAARERKRARAKEEAEAKAGEEDKPKRGYKGVIALAVSLVAIGAGGAALSKTKYGAFGMHVFEQFLPDAGDPARVRSTIEQAETQALDDTFTGARASLRTLAGYRRNAGLNRELLTRSLLHESLFIARHGDIGDASTRASRIARRLDERGNDAPGIELALAAHALSNGNFGTAAERATRAAAADAADPYPELVLGETMLAEENFEEAANAYRRAHEKGGGARAQWGLARAQIALRHEDARSAIEATVASSPRHGDARLALARLERQADNWDAAVEAARVAAGLVAVEGDRLHAQAPTRARSFALLGRLYGERGQLARARQMYELAVQTAPDDVESLVGAGNALVAEGRFRDSITRFRTVLEAGTPEEFIPAAPEGERPYLDQSRLGLARALVELERPEEARAPLMELLAKDEADAEVIFWLGRVAAATDGSEEAIERFRESIRLSPDRYDAYVALAQLYFDADQPEDAAAVLADAETHVAMTADVRRMRGESQVRLQNYTRAAAEFRAALELDEHDLASRFLLGKTLRRLGQLDAADEVFAQVAERDPNYAGLAVERGRLFEDRRQPERAVRAYQRALEADPESVALKLRLGAAFTIAQRNDEAEATLQEVLEEQPRAAEAIHLLGRVELQRGNLSRAIQLLGQAVQIDPTVASFQAYLAWAALDQNDLPRARIAVDAALSREPDHTIGLWARGELSVRIGRARPAIDDLIRVVRDDPTMLEAWASLGHAYDELGDQRQAIVAYQRAVNGRPSAGDWWYMLGRLQRDVGENRAASTSLARATVLGDEASPPPPWLPSAYRARADTHRDLGERAQAIRAFERYLEVVPGNAPDRGDVERILLDLRAR